MEILHALSSGVAARASARAVARVAYTVKCAYEGRSCFRSSASTAAKNSSVFPTAAAVPDSSRTRRRWTLRNALAIRVVRSPELRKHVGEHRRHCSTGSRLSAQRDMCLRSDSPQSIRRAYPPPTRYLGRGGYSPHRRFRMNRNANFESTIRKDSRRDCSTFRRHESNVNYCHNRHSIVRCVSQVLHRNPSFLPTSSVAVPVFVR